jgi:hypothetical protein
MAVMMGFRFLTPLHAEHLLVSGVRQRLEHCGPVQVTQEGFDLCWRARYQGARVDLGRQIGQVQAAPGAKHALGIVDHEGAAQAQAPAKIQNRRRRRGVRFAQGIVADDHHIEARQGVVLADGIG